MKYDPFIWSEVIPNQAFGGPMGRLVLNLSAPAALFISAEGVESCAGYGAFFDLSISEAYSFRVEASKSVRVFVRDMPNVTYEPTGESYTNIERLPMESGSMIEIKKALRMQKLEQRELLNEIRRETRELHARRKALVVDQEPGPSSESEADAPGN